MRRSLIALLILVCTASGKASLEPEELSLKLSRHAGEASEFYLFCSRSKAEVTCRLVSSVRGTPVKTVAVPPKDAKAWASRFATAAKSHRSPVGSHAVYFEWDVRYEGTRSSGRKPAGFSRDRRSDPIDRALVLLEASFRDALRENPQIEKEE